MPMIHPSDAPVFTLHGVVFNALASPSRGSTRNAVWTVCIETDAAGVTHQLSDEESFVCLSGRAIAIVGGAEHQLSAGCALVVPAATAFSLTKVGEEPFRAVVVLPAGATAQVGDGEPFIPPWAE
jgi:mannose-6-phosphate isomerase-like protein (cupin superfamily)